jgi:hypothetical protein
MGLLEYQATPSFREVAHNGSLCTFTLQLGSFCQGNRYSMEKEGDTARPSHTKSHLLGHSSPASQADCRVGPAIIYSFRHLHLLRFPCFLKSYLVEKAASNDLYAIKLAFNIKDQ